MTNEKEEQFFPDLSLSDLPDDIVIDILERLDSLARVRFSAVCRGWKLLIKRHILRLKEAEELPWIVDVDQPSIVLRQPCFTSQRKKSCITIDAIAPDSVFAMDAKFGWIIFQQLYYLEPTNLFLYSPFTKKYMYVQPKLPSNICHRVTISHPPTCPDCVFFVFAVADFEMEGHLCIYTCRIGDKNWKKHDVVDSVPGVSKLDSVMFLGGSFYCLFDLGTLAAFNATTESWTMLTELNPLIGRPPIINGNEVSPEFSCSRRHFGRFRRSYSRNNFHLVKSHGDIWLVHVTEFFKSPEFVGCSVWKYEWGNWGWTKMKSLGGQVMFLDRLFTGTAAVAAVGHLEGLADRIYFDSDDEYYYSLQDDKVHHDPHLDEDQLSKQRRKFWIVPPSPQL